MNDQPDDTDADLQHEHEPPDRPRHLFQGTRAYRVSLLVMVLALAVLLALGNLLFWEPSNWVRAIIPWLGVTSCLTFAALLLTDMIRPQALTATFLKWITRALIAVAGLAITLAILAFFV